MKNVSSNIGNKPIGLSLGLADVSIGSYSRRYINISKGFVSSGMQKLADRFIVTLFNQVGSTKHDEAFGTDLVQDVMVGSSMNFGIVQSNVAIAVASAESQIIDDDESLDYPDVPPADERLASAVCDSVEYDAKTGVLRLYVSLTSVAGEDYTYVLPVNLEFLG